MAARPARASGTVGRGPDGGFWSRHQRRIAPLLMLVPALVLFLALVAWPIIASIRLSLFDFDGINPARFIAFGNYRELLADPIFHIAAVNNLVWVAAFLTVAPGVGLLLALLLNRQLPGLRVYRTLLLFPFIISQAAVGTIFALLFNPEFGPLARAGEPGILDHGGTAIFGVIIASLWSQIAYCMILFLAGLAGLDREIVDAGRLDGARGSALLRRIIFPQLRPATVVIVVVSVVSALRSFDLVSIMTNGGPADRSMVLGLYVYQQTFLSLRYGYGAAVAVVLLIATNFAVAVLLATTFRRRQL